MKAVRHIDILPKFAGKLGGYNESPPNMKEISEDEFYRRLLMYHPTHIDFKQVFDYDDGTCMNLHLFIYDEGEQATGIAIGEVNRQRKFFSFATCQHEWEKNVAESRMCYHVAYCKKCGVRIAIDSSD